MTISMTRAAAGLAAALTLLLAGSLPIPVRAAAVPATDDAASPLTTLAERSGLRQTGRYDEVIRLCDAFAQQFPQAVRCERFGTTPEGRPMLALIVSARGAFTPEAAQQLQLPVMLIQGGIHAGEIDGKDAGFIALRQALRRRDTTLQRQVLVFVPVFNVDGHERFGAWNRPNQVGPEQMGWRTTAQNFNLNRDYVKADAPEMQAMLRLIQRWDPLITVDLHVTDGAKFEHDVSITLEPLYSGDAALRDAGRALRDEIIGQLRRKGSLPLPFYPSFDVEDDPMSGFTDGVSPPRYSSGYFVQRNRFGVLVETHSWKDYATRVRVTTQTIDALLAIHARQGAAWQPLARAADARAASTLAGQPVALSYKASERSSIIEFRGYEYTRTPSAVSGALMTRYDDRKPQIWRVPLRDDVQVDRQVTAPRRGYLVPAASAALVAAKLDLHGLQYTIVDAAQSAAPVQTFRATQTRFSPQTFEGHTTLSVDGQWQNEARDIPAGSLMVPIAQPRARLLMTLLEPQSEDSLLAWGFFNGAYEPKEYLEAYVAEDIARQMLDADPALADAFQQRLASDAAFAADPQARLAFFARRAPSWDERLGLYPVYRLD